MSQISLSTETLAGRGAAPVRRGDAPASRPDQAGISGGIAATPARPGDSVELSERARELLASPTAGTPGETPIRQDLVDRVRAEIAAGTYDSPDRLDRALDAALPRLARDLDVTA